MEEKEKSLEERVKEIKEIPFLGFEASKNDTQLIVEVLSVLENRNITISRAVNILKDAAEIIPLIKDF